MSRFQIMEHLLLHPSSSSVSVFRDSSCLFIDELECHPVSSLHLYPWRFGTFEPPLDLLPPSPFDLFETAVDLIHVETAPYSSSVLRRLRYRREREPEPALYIRSLCDRVTELELGVDRVLADRKYKWTAEIKAPEKCGGLERKYKCVAEVKPGKGNATPAEKSFKWTAEIKGKGANGPITKTYTFHSSTAPAGGAAEGDKCGKKDKKEKKEKKSKTQLVEIEDADPAAIALKQVFARRKALAIKNVKGKKKELSPLDAAILIQVTFRTHLVRRSKALRELRELAVAKAKLKEIRALFHNYTYRRHIACDTEERQRFSEKIIVLLLTVDAIEGSDLMVRTAKKSMVDELEAMLEVVDPQPPGKLGSLRRRKFDLPEGPLQKEIALGVAEFVQMLDQEENGSSSFEASL